MSSDYVIILLYIFRKTLFFLSAVIRIYDYKHFYHRQALFTSLPVISKILNSLKYGCTNGIVLFHPMFRRPVSDSELLCLKVPRLCPLGKENIQLKMKH